VDTKFGDSGFLALPSSKYGVNKKNNKILYVVIPTMLFTVVFMY